MLINSGLAVNEINMVRAGGRKLAVMHLACETFRSHGQVKIFSEIKIQNHISKFSVQVGEECLKQKKKNPVHFTCGIF